MAAPWEAVGRLLNTLTCYSPDSKRRINDELTALLKQILSLHCKIEKLVHDDGRASMLLLVHGTIPIYYRSIQYNIPVSIWLLEAYPTVPPKCYVTPTPDMRVKERHRHVDQNGLIYLPYLHHWKAGVSNLDELVSYMSSVFSDDPPVYRVDPSPVPVARRSPSPPPVVAVVQPKPAAILSPRPAASPVSVSPGMSSNKSGSGESVAQLKERLVTELTTKLQRQHSRFNSQFSTELDGLFDKQQALSDGARKIQEATSTLKREQDMLSSSLQILNSKIAELQTWLQQNEKNDELDVDAAVVPQDVWSRQLFEAVASDMAIEDTLFALSQAMQEERMDVQAYLRLVRKLARSQFYHRALTLKIVSKQQALNALQSGRPSA